MWSLLKINNEIKKNPQFLKYFEKTTDFKYSFLKRW